MSGALALITPAMRTPIARAAVTTALSVKGRDFVRSALKAVVPMALFDAFVEALSDTANQSGTVGDILRALGAGGDATGEEGDVEDVRVLTPRLERRVRSMMARTGLSWADLATLTRLTDEHDVLLQYAKREDGFNG